MQFPAIEARNLVGRRFNLPADFEGGRNLVLMAFRREHQALVDSWLPALRELAAGHPDLKIYEVPMLAWYYFWMRPMIDGGMAMAIPERQVRETTLTVYTDLSQVTRALAITNTNTITLFLVDSNGTIHWRCEGGYDQRRHAELASVLAANAPQTT